MHFSSGEGADACLSCPVGKYQNAPGKSFCEEAKPGHLVRKAPQRNADSQGLFEEWRCPKGMRCQRDGPYPRKYAGGVWHSTTDLYPNRLYTCINNGCPDEGETEMKCKAGYLADAPLCALCEPGYYMQLLDCVECAEPRVDLLVLVVVGALFALFVVVRTARKYGQLVNREVVAHLKILVSFFTIVSTVNVQFGVKWPASFNTALAVLSGLSLDLSVLSGAFCLFKVGFFSQLVFQTAGLAAVVVGLFLYCRWKPESKRQCTKFGVYLLIFAYPVVARKIVEAYSCHNVDDTYYLRADYSLKCSDPQWLALACYASFFLVTYVAGLPVYIFHTLFRYSKRLGGRKSVPRKWLLGFLLDDYKLLFPCLFWDGAEMFRKLLFSTIGSFWSNKGTMSVATALLLSVVFLVVQHRYTPFKSSACNRTQECCLCALSLLYFAGLLLKVDAVGASEQESLGDMLVALLVMVFAMVLAVIVNEVHSLAKAVRVARHCAVVLRQNCGTTSLGKNAVLRLAAVFHSDLSAAVYLCRRFDHLQRHCPACRYPCEEVLEMGLVLAGQQTDHHQLLFVGEVLQLFGQF